MEISAPRRFASSDSSPYFMTAFACSCRRDFRSDSCCLISFDNLSNALTVCVSVSSAFARVLSKSFAAVSASFSFLRFSSNSLDKSETFSAAAFASSENCPYSNTALEYSFFNVFRSDSCCLTSPDRLSNALTVSSSVFASSSACLAASSAALPISSSVLLCFAISNSFPLIAAFKLFILICIFCAASEFSPSLCTISASFFS